MRFCLVLCTFWLVSCAKTPVVATSRDADFEKMLHNVTLSGQATAGDRLLQEDRYVVERASRLTGDTWLIHARIGKSNVAVPVPVQVVWAGDTPVITLTDVGIPGMEKYTARVLFYRGQYAGTWSSSKVGGHLFGKITANPQ